MQRCHKIYQKAHETNKEFDRILEHKLVDEPFEMEEEAGILDKNENLNQLESDEIVMNEIITGQITGQTTNSEQKDLILEQKGADIQFGSFPVESSNVSDISTEKKSALSSEEMNQNIDEFNEDNEHSPEPMVTPVDATVNEQPITTSRSPSPQIIMNNALPMSLEPPSSFSVSQLQCYNGMCLSS